MKINLCAAPPADLKLREVHAAFSDCLPLLVHWLTGSVEQQASVAQLLKDRLRVIEALSGQARRQL